MQAMLFLPNFVLNFIKGSTSALKIQKLLEQKSVTWRSKDTPNAYCQNSGKREFLSSVF